MTPTDSLVACLVERYGRVEIVSGREFCIVRDLDTWGVEHGKRSTPGGERRVDKQRLASTACGVVRPCSTPDVRTRPVAPADSDPPVAAWRRLSDVQSFAPSGNVTNRVSARQHQPNRHLRQAGARSGERIETDHESGSNWTVGLAPRICYPREAFFLILHWRSDRHWRVGVRTKFS